MITLTTEQAQQIEEALEDIVRVFKFETGTPVEALAVIRAARAQGQAEQAPVVTDEELNRVLNWMADNTPSHVFETVKKRLYEQYDQILELDKLCNATYVAIGADAYNHACDEMEAWQEKRRERGQEVGTTGSLCDGIAWLYERIEHLEAGPVRTKDLTDDEMVYLWNMATSDFDFARAVIAKFKEKNRG